MEPISLPSLLTYARAFTECAGEPIDETAIHFRRVKCYIVSDALKAFTRIRIIPGSLGDSLAIHRNGVV